MADVDGDLHTIGDPNWVTYDAPIAPFETDTFDVPVLTIYRMRARDANSVSLTYRRWQSATADFAVENYFGAFDGVSRNFVEVTVTGLEDSTFD